MTKIKAILCTRYGPPDVLKLGEVEKPVPQNDEVLIKIRATSVTNSDLFIRSSNVVPGLLIPFRLMIGITRPRNPVIGEVFSGEVEAAGPDIRRFKPGDEVYGLTGFSLGAYADYKCMKEVDSKRGCLAQKPRTISHEDATSAAYGGLLALQFLEKGHIAPGQKVLIYGASGTCGTIAVQHAKYLGATVTGVCGPSHVELVRSLGADKVLDYRQSESIPKIEKYDFILDAVGKAKSSPFKTAAMKAIARNGHYVSIDDENLMLSSKRLETIADLVELGKIRPITDRVFDFAQIVEAHKYVETGHKTGNVAITVNG